MTLYELNKNMMAQMPIKTEEELEESKELIADFYLQKQSPYYMLLCKDISYYTIFTEGNYTQDFDTLSDAVIACVQDIGDIIDINLTENDTIEIWVKNVSQEIMVMYLFEASEFVVTF